VVVLHSHHGSVDALHDAGAFGNKEFPSPIFGWADSDDDDDHVLPPNYSSRPCRSGSRPSAGIFLAHPEAMGSRVAPIGVFDEIPACCCHAAASKIGGTD
jgi:hypothetical protein